MAILSGTATCTKIAHPVTLEVSNIKFSAEGHQNVSRLERPTVDLNDPTHETLQPLHRRFDLRIDR